MLNIKLFMDAIHQNGISHVRAHFSGGGDSGAMEEINIYDKNDNIINEKIKGTVKIKINKSIFDPKTETWRNVYTYEPVQLYKAIDRLIENALNQVEIDWYNNEGGGGDIKIDFKEENPIVSIYSYRYAETQYDEDGELIENDNDIAYQNNQEFELADLL